MNVYWLEQSNADAPTGNDWLSEREARFLDSLRFARRRADWRLGRWTAKRAVSIGLHSPHFDSDLTKIEIRGASSGAPCVFIENAPAPIAISLSHRDGRALCALTRAGVALGCDLEVIEPHSDAFVADYFTPEEQQFVAHRPVTDGNLVPALLWSAKEAALKALREGLRLDTRSVAVQLLDVTFDAGGWRPLKVTHRNGRIFHGWWQTEDKMVRVIVASPSPVSPVCLAPGDFHGSAAPFSWPRSIPFEKRGNALPVAD
jgi:4'-phosphopantetheinyl transferase